MMNDEQSCPEAAAPGAPGPAGEPEDGYYGGQAVLEGVMMRNRREYAIAVRRTDGRVIVETQPVSTFFARHAWTRWPLLRGFFGFIDAFVLGYRSLEFSGQVLAKEEEERAAAEAGEQAEESEEGSQDSAQPKSEPGGLSRAVMTGTMVLSVLIGIALFAVLPTLLAEWIVPSPAADAVVGDATADVPAVDEASAEGRGGWLSLFRSGPAGKGATLKNVTEGLVRLALILGYMLAISLLEPIRRVFQYHGAEHQAINTFEAGEAVTVKTARKHSPLHPRCGTGFLLTVIVVKLILGWFFGWPAPWVRVLLRLALLVPVSMLAYEIIRATGKWRHSLWAKVVMAPGLALQRVTTRRPDDEQLEIALHALAAVCPQVDPPSENAERAPEAPLAAAES